jgi:hypothetical protein
MSNEREGEERKNEETKNLVHKFDGFIRSHGNGFIRSCGEGSGL